MDKEENNLGDTPMTPKGSSKYKVVFLEPPLDYTHTHIFPRHPPHYAAYAAALVEKNGFDVAIIDAFMKHFTERETISAIEKSKPDMVIILPFDYTRETPIDISIDLARGLRERLPSVKIGLAGSMDSDFFKGAMEKSKDFDFAIIGEYEIPCVELVKAIKTGRTLIDVPGLLIMENQQVIQGGPQQMVKDLDALPVPAWHLLSLEDYTFIPHRYRYSPFYPLLAGRGCPFACLTCKEARQSKITNFRIRSVSNVIEEIRFAIREYGAKEIQFSDPTFGLKREWVFELCDTLESEGFNIPWSALTRVDVVDSKMLKRMARAGCWNLLYGIESGNPHTLDIIKKGFSLEQATRTIRATKEAGILTTGSFILGLPGETEKDVLATIDFAINLDLDYAQFFLLKHIGQKSDLAPWGSFTKSWDMSPYDFRGPVFIPSQIESLDKLKALQKLAYRRFYFRWSFIRKTLSELSEPGQIKRLIAGGKIALKAAFSK